MTVIPNVTAFGRAPDGASECIYLFTFFKPTTTLYLVDTVHEIKKCLRYKGK